MDRQGFDGIGSMKGDVSAKAYEVRGETERHTLTATPYFISASQSRKYHASSLSDI